jgi:signal transduction histidine kinase
VVADARQIQQALANLVVNAVQATGNGGNVSVALTSEMVAAPPSPGIPPGHYLRLSVRDTGIGMDADTQARMFDPFFTTKDIGEGTGLGLSISYGIVHEHGGWIAVASELGHGTQVSIFLPELPA